MRRYKRVLYYLGVTRLNKRGFPVRKLKKSMIERVERVVTLETGNFNEKFEKQLLYMSSCFYTLNIYRYSKIYYSFKGANDWYKISPTDIIPIPFTPYTQPTILYYVINIDGRLYYFREKITMINDGCCSVQ